MKTGATKMSSLLPPVRKGGSTIRRKLSHKSRKLCLTITAHRLVSSNSFTIPGGSPSGNIAFHSSKLAKKRNQLDVDLE